MCENNSESTALLISLGLLVLSELLGMSKFKENSVIMLVLHRLMKLFPYESKRERSASQAEKEELLRLRQERSIQLQQDAEPEIVYQGPSIGFGGIYSLDELTVLPLNDLMDMARSFGQAEMANRGNRDELIRFLSSVEA